MTTLPSLVSSESSSSSEGTSSASVDVDTNIRASLTLPVLPNNARSVHSQPENLRPSTRHQNRPRLCASNQQQDRHTNRADRNHYTPHGHQADNYFHHGNSIHANKSSTTSECNLSICYFYLLAAISSMMIVVGIYFSLTRFNLNYLYLSLTGLLLEALGACLYCMNNVQLNRKSRRKLRLSDDDFEGLAAAAAASHILNSRGLVQINTTNLNPVALRNVNNQSLATSSACEINNNESLLVMINTNNDNGSISPNPPTSAQKQIQKVPLEHSDQSAAMQRFNRDRPQQIDDQLINAEEALSSSIDNSHVAMSQLSLNMIPQYFSNGVSLRPNKSSQPIGPSTSNVINLTSGAFGKITASKTSPVNTESSIGDCQVAFQLREEEPIASSSKIETTTATPRGSSSNDQRNDSYKYDPILSRIGGMTTDKSNNTAMGPLSQSQIVNVNGRQFLILPLNDTKTSLIEQSTSNDSQDSNDNSESSRSNKPNNGPTTSSNLQSPYTQETTELIDKIRILTSSDKQQVFKNIHTEPGQSFINFPKPQPLRRESSFTYNNAKESLISNGATPSTSNKSSNPKGLRQSHSFNDKFNVSHRLATASLLVHDPTNFSCVKRTSQSNEHHQQCNELQPSSSSLIPIAPIKQSSTDIQACSSSMSESTGLLDNIRTTTNCANKTTQPIDETDDLSQNHPSRDLENSDRGGSVENSVVGTNKPKLSDSVEPQNNKNNQEYNNLLLVMQPSTSRAHTNSNQGTNQTTRPTSGSRASSSNAHQRTTLIMGLSGEEELIEINEADIDNMSMLPPSYESLMGQTNNS